MKSYILYTYISGVICSLIFYLVAIYAEKKTIKKCNDDYGMLIHLIIITLSVLLSILSWIGLMVMLCKWKLNKYNPKEVEIKIFDEAKGTYMWYKNETQYKTGFYSYDGAKLSYLLTTLAAKLKPKFKLDYTISVFLLGFTALILVNDIVRYNGAEWYKCLIPLGIFAIYVIVEFVKHKKKGNGYNS